MISNERWNQEVVYECSLFKVNIQSIVPQTVTLHSPFTFSYLISKLIIRIVVFHVNHLCRYPQSLHLIWDNASKALDTWQDSDVDMWKEVKAWIAQELVSVLTKYG